MFGIRFIKVQPTTYLLQYSKGKVKREGRGLAFFYFAPTTSLVAVPMESVDVPFIFELISADFQEITMQGQVTYRIVDAKQVSQLLNFTLDHKNDDYVSSDSEKLPERVINTIQVLMQSELSQLSLREALGASNQLVQKISQGLNDSKEITSLGLEVLGFSILSIKPNPETARALEADIREQLLKEADEAIYARRNASVELERAIQENELETEIAIEHKKREVREAEMEAERTVKEKERLIREEEMEGQIKWEIRNKELVGLASENLKQEADAKAYSLTAAMKAIAGVDPRVLQALASMDMNPSQLIALAFHDLVDSSHKIGHLNISPELLTQLLQDPKKRK